MKRPISEPFTILLPTYVTFSVVQIQYRLAVYVDPMEEMGLYLVPDHVTPKQTCPYYSSERRCERIDFTLYEYLITTRATKNGALTFTASQTINSILSTTSTEWLTQRPQPFHNSQASLPSSA